MMAQGKPDADETALLDRFRAHLPEEVFGEPYTPPVSDGSGQDRTLLRKAAQLLGDAGCTIQNGRRALPNGEPFSIEFLIDEPSFEPHHMAFIRNLKTLGIDATLRLVDPVQSRARRDSFDFDITIDRFSFSSTPGDSLRSFFSSQAARLPGSNNLSGISDPTVDALIDIIIAANSRSALVTACRALDRVIRAGRYWVPNWYKASHWIAYWDVFGRPPAQPRYFRGIPDTWWYDPDKAAKIKLRG
jgi:microcin C transport system substrate-binding protein